MVMPWRASICDWRYSGRESQNLLTTTCTISASVAMPPSIGRSGAGPDHGALAGAAGIARTARDPHPQLCGHDVELLGAEFADGVQRAAAAGTCLVLDVDHHLVARQMRRQGAMVARRRAPRGFGVLLRCGGRILGCLALGDRLLQVLQPELQLVRAQLFGPAAEPMAHQALDQQPQFVVLGVQLALLVQQRRAASAARRQGRPAGCQSRSARLDDGQTQSRRSQLCCVR